MNVSHKYFLIILITAVIFTIIATKYHSLSNANIFQNILKMQGNSFDENMIIKENRLY